MSLARLDAVMKAQLLEALCAEAHLPLAELAKLSSRYAVLNQISVGDLLAAGRGGGSAAVEDTKVAHDARVHNVRSARVRKAILALLKRHGTLPARVFASELHLPLPRVREVLQALIVGGRVTAIGRARGRKYALV